MQLWRVEVRTLPRSMMRPTPMMLVAQRVVKEFVREVSMVPLETGQFASSRVVGVVVGEEDGLVIELAPALVLDRAAEVWLDVIEMPPELLLVVCC